MTASLETRPRSRRRFIWWSMGLTVLLVAVGLGGLGYWYHVKTAQIDPPAFETAGVDPAVVRALQEKTEAVRRTRTATAWGELGMTFYVHKFTDQAQPCFRQAEKLQPDEPRWLYFQALGLAPENAIGKLRRTVILCGDSPNAPHLLMAEKLLELDQDEAAAKQFVQILAKDPENARAHVGMARLEHKRGDLEKSLQHLAAAKMDEHTRKAAHLLLAQVYQERDDSDAAGRAKHMAQKMPQDVPWPDPWYEEMARLETGLKGALVRANRFLRQGRLDDAASLLKEAAQEYPQAEAVLDLLAKVYIRQRDFPAAEAVLEKTLQMLPNSAEALFRLGVVFSRQNRTGEATAKFRRAIELQPGFGNAYYDLGLCLVKEGDRPGAIAAFRSAIQAMPENTSAHQALGTQLSENGQYAEAVAEFQTTLKLDPDDQKTRDLLEFALKQKPH